MTMRDWCPACDGQRQVVPGEILCVRCEGDLDLELLDLGG